MRAMTNRKKLPHGCWVTVFSSSTRTSSGRQAGPHQGAPERRHRHRTPGPGGALGSRRNTRIWHSPATSRVAQPIRPRTSNAHPHVLPEVLFRDTLAREERRADRFDDSFVLVLVASSATGSSGGPQVTPCPGTPLSTRSPRPVTRPSSAGTSRMESSAPSSLTSAERFSSARFGGP